MVHLDTHVLNLLIHSLVAKAIWRCRRRLVTIIGGMIVILSVFQVRSVALVSIANKDMQAGLSIANVDIKAAENLYIKAGENLCVLIRTYAGHSESLVQLLLGLAITANEDNFKQEHGIQNVLVYVTNTHHQPSLTADQRVQDLMLSASRVFPVHSRIRRLHFVPFHSSKKELYGYDATNFLLNYTLHEQGNYSCDRYLVTNGDNIYNRELISRLNTWMLDNHHDDDMINFHFITHHPRDGRPNSVLGKRFARGNVDLGSVVFRKRVVTDLCPDGPLFFDNSGQSWYAADWFFFQKALHCHATYSTIPEVLFLHQ